MSKARNGRGFSVDATGSRRRIEALQALGWPAEIIAAEGDWAHRNDINRIRTLKWVERKTAARIAEVYERLCMSIGPSDLTRRRALRRGWVPPLNWDDIDNDPAPVVAYGVKKNHEVDEALVLRATENAETDLYKIATPAERSAIARRWVKSGRPLNELARLTGWKVERYYKDAA